MKSLLPLAFVALVACGDKTPVQPEFSLNDPAVLALFEMPTPQFYAMVALAQEVAAGCPAFSYDVQTVNKVDSERNNFGRGSLTAAGLQNAIELETNVATRGFEAKHSASLADGNLCPAIETEKAQGSALGRLLAPVPAA